MRGRRRRDNDRLALAASKYAGLGWPLCPGASPREGQPRQRQSQRPGSRSNASRDARDAPRSPSSQHEPAGPAPATGSAARHRARIRCRRPGSGRRPPIRRWLANGGTNGRRPASCWSPEGRSTCSISRRRPGQAAIRQLERTGIRSGPVAASAMDRTLFFVATRAGDGDEDEWWSCHLDCEPELLPEVTGLRWHCRDSYVVAPPSPLSSGMAARWLTEPDEQPLPDALRLLEVLADACEETA